MQGDMAVVLVGDILWKKVWLLREDKEVAGWAVGNPWMRGWWCWEVLGAGGGAREE